MNQHNAFFLYVRKSTDVEDKQMLSIDAQITELRAYAEREKICIKDTFIEKRSAKSPGRPVFTSMLDKLGNGVSGILAWHPDRLARNSVDGGRIIHLIDTGNIKHLKFPQFWFEPTPQGIFMLTIAFGQSKYFVDSLSENTKRGLRQKVRRGEYPCMAPIGYYNDKATKTIKVDLQMASVVKDMFQMYAEGYTLYDIACFLASKGIKTRGGKIFQCTRVSYILTNPFYIGLFRYFGEIHEGTHEPIIAKKLFDKVQKVHSSRSKPWTKKRIPKAFTGLFRCGECGMMITAEIQKGHVYYRCTKKSKVIQCAQKYTREESINKQISTMMQTVSLPRDWAENMMKRIQKEEKESTQSLHVFVHQKRQRLTAILGKLKRLLDTYLDCDIDQKTYRQKKADLLSEKKTLEESIIHMEQTHNNWLEPMKKWIQEASETGKIARGNDLFAKKELALKIFGSNLTLKNKRTYGNALNPWRSYRCAPTSRNLEPPIRIELISAVYDTAALPLS